MWVAGTANASFRKGPSLSTSFSIMHAEAYQNECFTSEPIKVRKETCKHKTKAYSLLSCYQITLVSSQISLPPGTIR